MFTALLIPLFTAVASLLMFLNVPHEFMPPLGGVSVGYALDSLLYKINDKEINSFNAHCEFEALHPFTDCNGRSGRMLWL